MIDRRKFIARCSLETRFQGPFGLIFEFQVDGQSRVTGAMVEQGPFRIPLARK
jgi:hypothetical protein